MTSMFTRIAVSLLLLAGLAGCSSSSGSATSGTQVEISATPVPANHPAQAAGTKTFNNDLGDSGAATADFTSESGFFAGNAQVTTDGAGEAIIIHYAAESEM